MKSIGVNPVDTYIRTGIHVIKPELPYIPGVDGAGIVEEIGESVTKLKVVYITHGDSRTRISESLSQREILCKSQLYTVVFTF